MPSCSNKILARSENGCISVCCKCGNFQVAFLSTIVTLSSEQFKHLQSEVNENYRCGRNSLSDNQKGFLISISSTAARMILSFNELKKLVCLLEQASAEAKISDFIQGDLHTIVNEFQKEKRVQLIDQFPPINLN